MTTQTTTKTKTNVYEGFFLFPQAAAANLQGALDHVLEILRRANAEVLSLCKWDERRLAYEIAGNKRGIYFLAFFRADGSRLTDIERDCNLSEQLLRTMITRAEYVPAERIQSFEGRERLADEIRLRRTDPKAVIESRPPAEREEADEIVVDEDE
jgi:small subunit ribosomal protein S6